MSGTERRYRKKALKPAIKRELVSYLTTQFAMSIRQACRTLSLSRTVYFYQPDSIVLSTVLAEHDTAGKTGTALRDLLCELTGYFVDEMMAPRWIRSEEGVSQIQYA